MKLDNEFSYLAFLRRKRRDRRDLAKYNKNNKNNNSTPEKKASTTIISTTTTTTNNPPMETVMKRRNGPPPSSMVSQPSIRLDEYGFITNLDENGQLHKSVTFVLPGGASTPSFDLYSTYSELRKNETKMYQQNLLDNKKLMQGRSINIRREKKWTIMLNDWNNSKLKKKKVRRRLRKGVPNSVRGQAWVHIQGVKEKVEIDQRGFYRELVRRSSGTNHFVETVNDVELQVTSSSQHKYDIDDVVSKNQMENQNNLVEVIERDIHRTFPRHHMFFDGSDNDTSDEDNHSDSDDSADDDSYDVASANGEKSLRNELEELENSSLHMEMLIKQSEDIDDLYSTRIANENSKQKTKQKPIKDTRKKPTSNTINDTNNNNNNNSIETSNGYGQKASQQLSLSRVLDHIETGNIPCNSVTQRVRQNKETKKISVTNVFSSVSSAVSNATKKTIEEPKQATKKDKGQSDYEVAKGGQASLRRVLRAYNIYDSDVGYCQGMNFIAAMFITYMSEEEAFWMLVGKTFSLIGLFYHFKMSPSIEISFCIKIMLFNVYLSSGDEQFSL